MLDIHTVGAGGGSIAWIDEGGALRVGPRSAGADPGPACYGRGGELPTVTDANLVLGRLDREAPLAGGLRLDRRGAPRGRCATRGGRVPQRPRRAPRASSRWPTQEMVRAIRVVSVEQGHDPRDLELVAFGGAGPLHACERGRRAGHPRGAGAGRRRRALGARHRRPASAAATRVARRGARRCASLRWPSRAACCRELPRERGARAEVVVRPALPRPGVRADRPAGAGARRLAERFHRRHRAALRVRRPRRRDRGGQPAGDRRPRRAPRITLARAPRRRARCAGRRRVPLDGATLWVAKGWTARRAAGRRVGGDAMIDPATLQVMAAALRGVAEEMGAALVRAAHSANIKERRDCSTALFDRGGRMIAQAEHMPVHLGAMPDAVAAVPRAASRGPRRRDGRQRPVHGRHAPARHHARLAVVGRPRPRGLPRPPRRRRRDAAGQHAGRRAGAVQEGLVIPPVRLYRGRCRDVLDCWRTCALPAERLADLRAQIACHAGGSGALARARAAARAGARCEGHGRALRATPSGARARPWRGVPDGRYRAADVIEGDGVTTPGLADPGRGDDRRRRAVVDFAGTAPQQPGNGNCPLAVTRSAVYFVVRACLRPGHPGLRRRLRPGEVRRARGLPGQRAAPGGRGRRATSRPPAASSTWCSRRSAGRCRLPAQGQGTMNNVTLRRRPGSPTTRRSAAARAPRPAPTGPSAVHVAM